MTFAISSQRREHLISEYKFLISTFSNCSSTLQSATIAQLRALSMKRSLMKRSSEWTKMEVERNGRRYVGTDDNLKPEAAKR